MTAYTIDTHETVRQLAAAGIKGGTCHQIGRKATRSVLTPGRDSVRGWARRTACTPAVNPN